jgi:Zn finger protein HypA/HybF involved in hydrogenase expression
MTYREDLTMCPECENISVAIVNGKHLRILTCMNESCKYLETYGRW